MKIKRKMLKAKRKCQELVKGLEKPSSKPMQIPINMKKPSNPKAQIREMIRNERLMHELDNVGLETFEDADDFNVGDDYDPSSPYEMDFDQELEYQGSDNSMQQEQPIPKPEDGEAIEVSKETVGEENEKS